MNCYFSKYEPIFGSWYITGELGSGAEGHLYRISREDALGNVFYSALKAITIPAGGKAEVDSLIAGGMSNDEVKAYFRNILTEAALGDGVKQPTAAEKKISQVVTKRLVAARAIQLGEVLNAGNIAVKRSSSGVLARDYDRVIGQRARRDYLPDEGLEGWL